MFILKIPQRRASTRAGQRGEISSKLLIGIGFVAVSLVMGWLIVGEPLQQWSEVRQWVRTPASIVEAELVESHVPGSAQTTYETTARYRYTFAGKIYDGTGVSIYGGSDNFSSFHHRVFRELSDYKTSGKPFRCYVNPDNPRQAVLYRDVRWGLTIFIGLLVILFCGGGIFVIVMALRETFVSEKDQPRSGGPQAGQEQGKDFYIGMYETMREAMRSAEQADGRAPSSEYDAVKSTLSLSSGVLIPAIRHKYVAALLALFFGWFGAHKFYLGKKVQGILYLLLFWTFIPVVISLVEAILLLTMSDETFAKKYGGGVKWRRFDAQDRQPFPR